MKTEVYCSLQAEGLHCWPTCPFGEVDYLRDLHRHLFYIKAYVPVFHSDRDIEFVMFKHEIEQYLNARYWDDTYKCLNFGPMSCEMIGQELIGKFNLSKVDVSEDNENGAVVIADGE